MLKKTLGGDRLGAGKKMTVAMKNFNRSTHDKGYIWQSTGSFGTLIPFMVQIAKPQDTWDIELACEILTHPTIGPVFGSAKVQLDLFLAPIRLYNSWLHNNKLNIGRDMSQVKLPQVELAAQVVEALPGDIDNSQVNPSCVLAYLGIRGIGMTGTTQNRQFNATSWLALWDIYKNYYANKQEEIGAVIHQPVIDPGGAPSAIESADTIPLAPAISLVELRASEPIIVSYLGGAPNPQAIIINTQYNGKKSLSELCTQIDDTGTTLECVYNQAYFGIDYAINYSILSGTDLITGTPQVTTFPLDNIDAMREDLLAWNNSAPYIVNTLDLAPYNYLAATDDPAIQARMSSQEGLPVKTYQSDLFNNWLDTDWIDDINSRSAVSTVGNSFTMDQLLVAEKVYDFLNRIAASDGTYYSWIEAAYAPPGHRQAETPMYMGGLTKELVFQEVISNSASAADATQPLGTLGGRGKLGSKHKGGKVHIKVEEPSYIIGLISVTPRLTYSQGNAWDIYLENLDQLHKPSMDQIGFQDLLTRQMAWWDETYTGGNWVAKSAGKQPAWINYQTEINKSYGNFAIRDNEMFMTFNRRYEYNGSTIQDLTTYIDPAKFNFIFAQTALDAQNLWMNVAVDAEVRQLMSANIMPAL